MIPVQDRLSAFKPPKGWSKRRDIPQRRIIGLLRRWSTPKQNDNYSNERQFTNLEHRCDTLGYGVRHFDSGQVSGGDLSKNDDAIHLLQAIQDGEIHGIGVVNLDRLSREATGSDLAFILQICIENDAILVTETQVLDPNDASHMLQAKMQGSVASMQRSYIRDTMIRGKAGRLIRGPVTNAAGAPLGYCHVSTGEIRANGRVTRKIEKCPEGSYERELVEAFWDVARDAASLIGIAKELNRRGLLYPRRRNVASKGQRVDWDHQLVRLVLEKPIYSGWLVFNNDTAKQVWKHQPEFQDGPVRRFDESLVYLDERSYRRIRDRLVHQKGDYVVGVRGRNAPHPLFGILLCQHCGAKMYNHHDYRNQSTYLCSSYRTRRGSCPGQSISERLALGAVFSILHALSAAARDEAARRAHTLSGADYDQELRDAQDRLSILDARREKLITTIAVMDPDPKEMVTWQAQVRDLREQIHQAEKDVDAKASLLQHQKVLGEIPLDHDGFLAAMLGSNLPWQLQRDFIGAVFQEVTVTGFGPNSRRAARVASFKYVGSDETYEVAESSAIYAPRGMPPVSTSGATRTRSTASLPTLPEGLRERVYAFLLSVA